MIILKICLLLVFCYIVCKEFNRDLIEENEKLSEEVRRLKNDNN